MRNVLLIVNSGEQSWDKLPAHLATPARELLLGRSVEFSDFFAASPTSSPALAALLTGQHGPASGVTDAADRGLIATPLAPNSTTLASVMRDGGWHTAFFGDWPLSSWYRPKSRNDLLHDHGFGWCELTSDGGNAGLADLLTTRAATRWLATRAPTLSQPWLAVVRLHATAAVTEETLRDDALRSDSLDPSALATKSGATAVDAHKVTRRIARSGVGGARINDELSARLANRYDAAIESSDQRLGELLEAVAASGARSSTIVVYTSDCGTLLGQHGQIGQGPFIYDEAIRVPLFIDCPGAPGAVASEQLMSAVDVMPTILSLAHLPPYARIVSPGYSMARSVYAPASKGPRQRSQGGALVTHSALSTISQQFAAASDPTDGSKLGTIAAAIETARKQQRGLLRGVVTKRQKAARYFAPSDHHTPADLSELRRRNDLEAYNRHRDPAEERNIADARIPDAELLAELNGRINTLVAEEIGGDNGDYLPGPRFLWRS